MRESLRTWNARPIVHLTKILRLPSGGKEVLSFSTKGHPVCSSFGYVSCFIWTHDTPDINQVIFFRFCYCFADFFGFTLHTLR